MLVLAIQTGVGFLVVPAHGVVGQGVAGLAGMSIGCLAGFILMKRWIGNVFPFATAARVLAAGGGIYALSLAWHPDGKLLTLVRSVGCGVLYLAVVIALREFRAADLAKFRKVLPGGRRP